MDASTSRSAFEPRGRLFLRALVFLVPGLAVWAVASRHLFPKVQLIWRDGGATGSDVQWLMNVVSGLVEYSWLAIAAVAVTLALAELRPAAWAPYRRIAVGSAVALLNSAILFGLAALCILALFAAPGLRQA